MLTLDNTPPELRYPARDTLLGLSEFNEILRWARENDVSDIDLFPGDPVWVQRYGRRYPATSRAIQFQEIRALTDSVYRGSAMGLIMEGQDVNMAHEIRLSREESARFRINMSGALFGGQDGVNLTCRTLPSVPPVWEDLKIEKEIVENWRQPNGLTMVTGPTGSGKSTLLAAGIHEELRDPEAHRKFVTAEAPIEFVYDKVARISTHIHQSEVPKHFKTFSRATSAAMRRKPEVIMIGECKEVDTMEGALEACNTGHQTFTTLHTNSVPDSIRRAINFFPERERDGRALDIASSVRMLITQRLLLTRDGKRRAVREILVFDDQLRDRLADTPVPLWAREVRRMVDSYGQPMIVPIAALHRDGLIGDDEWHRLEQRAKARNQADEGAIDPEQVRSVA